MAEALARSRVGEKRAWFSVESRRLVKVHENMPYKVEKFKDRSLVWRLEKKRGRSGTRDSDSGKMLGGFMAYSMDSAKLVCFAKGHSSDAPPAP